MVAIGIKGTYQEPLRKLGASRITCDHCGFARDSVPGQESIPGDRMLDASEQEHAYAEIEAEASRLVRSSKKPLAMHAKQVVAALWQHRAGLPVIERCPYCSELLRVDAPSESAWLVVCPCGKSKDTFRGL